MTDTTSQTPDPSPDLAAALRRVHHSVLAVLALCAVVIATASAPGPDPGPGQADPRFTGAAVALGVGSILARRSAAGPKASVRGRVYWALAGLLLTGAIGGVGVALALLHGQRQAALLYTLGAAILALRPVAVRTR